MSNFKILGIRLLNGCDKKFCKSLQENTLYPFFKNRFRTGKNEIFIDLESQLDKNINNQIYPTSSSPKITVSAIVGENGSGKSTLIELISIYSFLLYSQYSNIKNKAIKDLKKELKDVQATFSNELSKGIAIEYFPINLIKRYRELKEKIDYIESEKYKKDFAEFHCELYFEQTNFKNITTYHKLTAKSGILQFSVQEVNKWSPIQYGTIASLKKNFFYSILLNYSVYSFRKKDFGTWIELM